MIFYSAFSFEFIIITLRGGDIYELHKHQGIEETHIELGLQRTAKEYGQKI